MQSSLKFVVVVTAMLWLSVFGWAVRAEENVLSFTGNGSYIDLGKSEALHMSANAPFTLEGWMKLNSTSSRDMLYSRRASRNSGDYTYMFGFIDGNKMSAYIGHGGSPNTTWRDIALNPVLETGRWYHLAYSFDGANLVYYLDGAAIGTQAFRFSDHAGYQVMLGGYTDASDIDGSKSDVRVWDHARDQAQIQDHMNSRLTGAEIGLIGYWPLNEGSGTTVHDWTPNDTEGTVINAAWVVDEELVLDIPGAGYLPALPFTLADMQTGSLDFTNSNEVDIVVFPIPEDYDLFQITESDDIESLGAWTSTSAIPGSIVYDQPAADTNIILYAWYTNSTEAVALRRGTGSIYYTVMLPEPNVRATLTIERLPGEDVVIYPAHLDAGSTGGMADGREMDLHARGLLWVSGPVGSADLTPEEPYVTVNAEGEYELRLWLQNEAGNTNLSSTCVVTVTDFSGVNSWTDLGATDLWTDPGNWSAGVPLTGQQVEFTSGTLLLAEPTAELSSFTMTGGTMTFSGWTTRLWATNVTVSGGTMTLPPAFGETDMSNRVWIVCENFSATGGGTRINVLGRGFDEGQGPGSNTGSNYAAGGGHGGIGCPGRGNSGWPTFGAVYGSVDEPTTPGSGSGWTGTAGRGARGGGAVFIDATGAVTIETTINAGGSTSSDNQGGGGAGGSIYIRCNTFAGNSAGHLFAGGGSGTYSSGPGAGGRIAVVYNSAAQQDMIPVNPGVRLSAPRHTGGGSRSHESESGTLFLPDTLFLAGDVVGAEFSDVNIFIPGFTHWTASGDVTIAGTVGFPELLEVEVAGDLTIQNGGMLRVFGGDTNTTGNAYYGKSFRVGGELRIEPNATLWSTMYAFNALFNEDQHRATTYFQVRSLTVEAGGSLIAPHGPGGSGYGPVSGPGAGGSNTSSGGGYGGAGAGSQGGQPYGVAHAPLLPGSGGGNPLTAGRGGGLILVYAADRVRIDGTLSANGDGGNWHTGQNGGSGGAILITCRQFEGGGLLQANGSVIAGGGRIAVWNPALSLDRLIYFADQDTAGTDDFLMPSADPAFTGEAAVTWGNYSGDVAVTGGGSAEPGSVFLGRYYPGTLLFVR